MVWTRILETARSEERGKRRKMYYMLGGRRFAEMQRDEKTERTIFQLKMATNK